MDRRDFLRILLASALAEAVDVERLLWVPTPIVTVPAMPPLPVQFLWNDHSFYQLVDGRLAADGIERWRVVGTWRAMPYEP